MRWDKTTRPIHQLHRVVFAAAVGVVQHRSKPGFPAGDLQGHQRHGRQQKHRGQRQTLGRIGSGHTGKPVSLPITACAAPPSTPPLHQPPPNRQDLSRQLIREPQQAFAHLLELSAKFQTWVDINALERSKDESDGYEPRRCLVFHRRNP